MKPNNVNLRHHHPWLCKIKMIVSIPFKGINSMNTQYPLHCSCLLCWLPLLHLCLAIILLVFFLTFSNSYCYLSTKVPVTILLIISNQDRSEIANSFFKLSIHNPHKDVFICFLNYISIPIHIIKYFIYLFKIFYRLASFKRTQICYTMYKNIKTNNTAQD